MLIAFDTATAATVVAVATPDGGLLAERRHEPATGERPGHLARLLPLAESALGEAGVTWRDVTRIGAGIGPGGFTGLRIGLATATGLALALGAETVPLSTPAALAAGCGNEVPALLVAIDARRGELFAQRFTAGEPAGAPFVAAPDDLGRLDGLLAVGDGADRHRAALTAAGATVPAAADPRHRVGGRALALVTARGRPGRPAPAYLREPDAVPRSVQP